MDFNSIINDVNSKEDFMAFLTELCHDRKQRSEEWENVEITSYLEGICSWVEDMEGYLKCFQIKFWYVRSFSKLYISGFNLGRKDFGERVKINDPSDDIRNRLWELRKRYFVRLALPGGVLCVE